MRGRGRQVGLVCVSTALAVVGCGSWPSSQSHDVAALPVAGSCASGWHEIYHVGSLDNGYYLPMLWHDGTLYFAVNTPSARIIALPVNGGDARILVNEGFNRAWIEGDHLLYTVEGDRLSSVPLSGGDPEVVFDGKTASVPPSYDTASDTELGSDGDHVFWDRSTQTEPSEWSLWRGSRSSGAVEKIADAPSPSQFWYMRSLNDGSRVVAFNADQQPYLLSLDGGAPRALGRPPLPASPYDLKHLGVSASGILWTRDEWITNDAAQPQSEVWLSDLGEVGTPGVHPFWTTKPPAMRPFYESGWPDGAGGWIVSGDELFQGDNPNDQRRGTIWAVDAAGNGRRLACSPQLGSSVVSVAVVTPDAFYGLAASLDGEPIPSFDFSVVRIPR